MLPQVPDMVPTQSAVGALEVAVHVQAGGHDQRITIEYGDLIMSQVDEYTGRKYGGCRWRAQGREDWRGPCFAVLINHHLQGDGCIMVPDHLGGEYLVYFLLLAFLLLVVIRRDRIITITFKLWYLLLILLPMINDVLNYTINIIHRVITDGCNGGERGV
jgi:hypothetical protein